MRVPAPDTRDGSAIAVLLLSGSIGHACDSAGEVTFRGIAVGGRSFYLGHPQNARSFAELAEDQSPCLVGWTEPSR